MKIRYEVTIEDLVASSKYHYRNTPELRRARSCGMVVSALVVFVIVFLLNEKAGILARAIPAALIAGLFLTIWPAMYWGAVEKQIRKLYESGTHKGALGKHEIEITDGGIRERTEFGEQYTTWEGIGVIGFEDNHTYVYVTPCTAHVIPREGIEEGSYDDVVKVLKEKAERPRA